MFARCSDSSDLGSSRPTMPVHTTVASPNFETCGQIVGTVLVLYYSCLSVHGSSVRSPIVEARVNQIKSHPGILCYCVGLGRQRQLQRQRECNVNCKMLENSYPKSIRGKCGPRFAVLLSKNIGSFWQVCCCDPSSMMLGLLAFYSALMISLYHNSIPSGQCKLLLYKLR